MFDIGMSAPITVYNTVWGVHSFSVECHIFSLLISLIILIMTSTGMLMHITIHFELQI